MQTATANALLASPYFRANGGIDHLLVADSYKLWDMERNSDFSLEFLQVVAVPPIALLLFRRGSCLPT